jgi:chorismate-pyruvate lyase
MNFKHSPSGLIQHISYLGDILKKHNWKKRKDDLCVLVELYALYEAPEIPKQRFWKRLSQYCLKHFNTNTDFNYEIFKFL